MNIAHLSGMAFWDGCYRILLRLLPPDFTGELGAEIGQTFRDSYVAEHQAHGRFAAYRFASLACLRVVACAVKMRASPTRVPVENRIPHSSRRPPLLAHLWQDARGALRGIVRIPGFSLTTIGIMGLGIGATTAVFSIVDQVLLRDLPYQQADRLVYFNQPATHSVLDFRDWRERTGAFERIVGSRVLNFDLTSEGRPRRLRTALVTDGFFPTFGAHPIVGSLFDRVPATDASQTVVISYQLWRDTWGEDADIVGRRLILNGEPAVIIGVMSQEFSVPEALVGSRVDAWMPFDLQDPDLQHRGFFVLQAAALLRPSATLATAQAELNVLAAAQANEDPDRYLRPDGTVRAPSIIPLYEATVTGVAGTLRMLMGAVVLMLLIACANVANLLLARGTDRQREITLRAALGAGTRRIAAQLLTEAVVLSALGGLLGVILAFGGVGLFVRANPTGVPRLTDAAIDVRVLAFALVTSVLTGMLFGILPAWQASRSDAARVLREGGRAAATQYGPKVRNALVVSEIAIALILVTGATVLFNDLIALRRIDPGIEVNDVITVAIGLNSKTPEQRAAFSRDVIARIERLPGVRAVGAGVTIPFAITGGGRCCWFLDFSRLSDDQPPEPATVHPVTAGYFNALGATITRGRSLTERDGDTEPQPAVINTTLAHRLFGSVDPVNQQIDMDGVPVTVVGVVNDIRHWGLDQPAEAEIYFPFDGNGEYFFRYYLAIRATAPVESLAPAIREAIWSVDSELPLDEVTTMRQRVTDSIATSRFYSSLMAAFAILALVLASAGVYGSMLYAVGQQYRELGVRLAIGARPVDVTRLVLGRAVVITTLGVGIGLLGTLLLHRTIEHLVVNVSPADTSSILSATLVLALVSMASSYVPARRAARADPLHTLRHG